MKCTRISKSFIFLKLLTTIIAFFTFSYFIIGLPNVYANEDNQSYLIPGGESIGIRVDTGIYVAGKYQVDTSKGKVSPWKQSDLKIGDKIIAIDGKKVMNNQDIMDILKNVTDQIVVLTVKRGEIVFDTNIEVAVTKTNEKSIGIYIKDRILGVGTLTFVDPETHQFGSLGHGIYDDSIPLGKVDGNILESSIASIKKAQPGAPGEKRALMKKDVIGSISLNGMTGLYGHFQKENVLKKSAIPVGKQLDVKVGPAYILTVINGGEIEKFDIQIIEVHQQSKPSVKGLKVLITDEDLISKTGGIIQGMSGSPIIQNGKIVGAISHVTVENPLVGYGIHIEWMLQEFSKFDKNRQ